LVKRNFDDIKIHGTTIKTNRVVFLGVAVPFDTVLWIEFLAQKLSIINFSTYLVETVSLYALTFIM
jgi:hypothetical protein